MSEYIVVNGQFYEFSDEELMHYGVRGMKWGVRRYQNADGTLTSAGKARDERLSEKVQKYSARAAREAGYASLNARQGINGSSNLTNSNRYLKKAEKAASKMSDKGDSLQDNETYRDATYRNREAGKNYIKRSAGERAATLAGSAALSAGAVYVSAMAGLPYTMVYVTRGPEYKLRGGQNGR